MFIFIVRLWCQSSGSEAWQGLRGKQLQGGFVEFVLSFLPQNKTYWCPPDEKLLPPQLYTTTEINLVSSYFESEAL